MAKRKKREGLYEVPLAILKKCTSPNSEKVAEYAAKVFSKTKGIKDTPKLRQFFDGDFNNMMRDYWKDPKPFLTNSNGYTAMDLEEYSQSQFYKNILNRLYSKTSEPISEIEIDIIRKLMFVFIDIGVLDMWKWNKVVYSFTHELEEALVKSVDENKAIPFGVLKSLPFPCAWYSTTYIEGYHGFFAGLVQTFGSKSETIEMVFLFIDKNMKINRAVINIVESKTIEEAVLSKVHGVSQIAILQALQYILYVCSQNTPIIANPEQKKRYKKSERVKDRVAEVKEYVAGKDFSLKVRSGKSRNPSGVVYISSGTGTAKQKHVRRGHYHHYWTGKRDSHDRKLVLRWISPLVVNADGKEVRSITVIKEDHNNEY